jgi:6,7-dimethyl-8-ribityllumazine synthase
MSHERNPTRDVSVRIALIVSRYNAFVTDRLAEGAREYLRQAGVRDEAIGTFAVPGADELAQAASRIARTREWAALVCLGCLIRGETPHFQIIADAVATGITRASQDTGLPIAFGVLTTNTADEAMARAGEGEANKGREAAAAALEMTRLYATLPPERPSRTP